MTAPAQEPADLDASRPPPAPITHRERAAYRPQSQAECYQVLQRHFDAFAPARDLWRWRNRYYHAELERLYRYHVPQGCAVLEVGCGTGDLLAALRPGRSLGVDLSPEMVRRAREKYPQLRFEATALEDYAPNGEQFDFIILSDLLGFVYDVQTLFERLKPFCHPRTRIIVNLHSRLWQPVLGLAEVLRLKYRQPVLNWLTPGDIRGLLQLTGFEVVQTDERLLVPKWVPLLSRLANRLSPLWPLRWLCLTSWVTARLPLAPRPPECEAELSVSVVCPCRNEAGNIPQVVARLPRMGRHTELLLVEGHSQDSTLAVCRQAQAAHPKLDISVYQQAAKGKKDALWLGFAKAKGDVLMVLDADLTVAPEDLPRFFEAIASGRAEFVNGSRLVYPMEGRAMRFLNLIGNKFFSLAFSYLVGQDVKDVLCGTKVLLRGDYQRLEAGRKYFGVFDPFGDFDLLFGAAKMGLKIVDLPVRYRGRTYGESQISRFRHGWMLLKMCAVGLVELKLR